MTLAEVPASARDDVTPVGIDAVWLMGAWERSPAGLDLANAADGARAGRRHHGDAWLTVNVWSPDLQLLPRFGLVNQARLTGRVTPSVSSLGIDSSGNPSKGTEFVCGVGGFQQ